MSLDGLGGAETAAEGATTAAITREVWQDVADAAHRILGATTIEALVERQRAREQRAMYHI